MAAGGPIKNAGEWELVLKFLGILIRLKMVGDVGKKFPNGTNRD